MCYTLYVRMILTESEKRRMKFENTPKKVEEQKQEKEVIVPKRKTRKAWIGWKTKGFIVLSVLFLIGVGAIKTLEAVSSWFDNNKMVFHQVVTVEVKPPFTIEPRVISPIPDEVKEASPSAMIQVVSQVQAAEIPVINGTVKGMASYYSEEGCLGCNAELIMANGEKLSDKAYTVALTPELVKEHKLLNDMVKITNVLTKNTVIAKVTDTGGFAKYNRVADLSVATKEALHCGHICEVEIVF